MMYGVYIGEKGVYSGQTTSIGKREEGRERKGVCGVFRVKAVWVCKLSLPPGLTNRYTSIKRIKLIGGGE
jgi:hypothetical protein